MVRLQLGEAGEQLVESGQWTALISGNKSGDVLLGSFVPGVLFDEQSGDRLYSGQQPRPDDGRYRVARVDSTAEVWAL